MHGMQSQLEGMDMTGDKWVLADLDKVCMHVCLHDFIGRNHRRERGMRWDAA